jgi:hypothetical protein
VRMQSHSFTGPRKALIHVCIKLQGQHHLPLNLDDAARARDQRQVRNRFGVHHGSPRAHGHSHRARRDIRILGRSRGLQPLLQMRASVKRVRISPLTIVGCQPGLGLNEIVGCAGAPSSSGEHAMRFCHSRTMVHKRASSGTAGSVILLVALRREG